MEGGNAEIFLDPEVEEGSALAVLASPSNFFSDASYWNQRYIKRSGPELKSNPTKQGSEDIYDWYFNLDTMISHPLIGKVFSSLTPETARILDLGCGNSALGSELLDYGFNDVIGIDFAEAVIELMKQKYGDREPKLKFMTMDARDLKFPNESFDLVFDKGSLDAVMFTTDKQNAAVDVLQQVHRILRPKGYYLVISSFPPEERIPFFRGSGIPFDLHQSKILSKKFYQYYVYLMTKIDSDTQPHEILEDPLEEDVR